ncbi:MAG: type II toxin-antitoxin system HicA family toxin [Nitrospinae bacterium]|nr:type II toxin-antitoxin system HicA family toxin [Nitrospinota bacterium]
MKYRELIRRIRELGYYLPREGANHEIWTNGERSLIIPRHPEIREGTAAGIIKKAEGRD